MCSLVGTYESYVRLCELLNEITPGTFAKKTLLSKAGAEAVENAVKAARASHTSAPRSSASRARTMAGRCWR